MQRVTPLEAAAAKALVDKRNLAISAFRPLKHQEQVFKDRPRYLLCEGGNRAGKTITLMALISSIVLDIPITFLDGTQHDGRKPHQKDRPLQIWIICIDLDHVGRVVYPALFKAGFFERFKVVHDPVTRKLRSYDFEADKHLKAKQHPPLIPGQYVSHVAWENKAEKQFSAVTISNPATDEVLAEIRCFTSKGDAPQGAAADVVYIEEQLARNGYYGEMIARLVDKTGDLIWASWAADTDEDDDLSQFNAMIDRETEAGSGVAKRVTLTMSGNTTFTQEMVAGFLAGCTSEEERQQRDLGIKPNEKLRMYPLFDKKVHSVDAYDDRIATALKGRDGIPPMGNDAWTRYLILDPGTQHPAVLLAAVPPEDYGDYVVIYQEIYPGRADPIQLAEIVAKETKGQVFYRWICDWHAGRQVTMGSKADVRVVDAYETAFKAKGLSCVLTKSKFSWGSDNVGGRQLVLQSWMHPNPKTQIPKLRIVTQRCPVLCEQLRKVKKKTVNKEVVDDRKLAGIPSDLVECLEYLAASGPKYTFIAPRIEDAPSAYQRYMKRFGNKKENNPIQIGTYY